MLNKNLATALGALTGLLGLVAMIRLASGAFSHGMSIFAWVAILSANRAEWLETQIGVRRMAWPPRQSQLARRASGAAA